MSRRVVVTGIGLVSPVGIGTADTWKAICAGQSGIAPITLFDASRHTTRFAGEVKGFDPLNWIEKKDVKKCARFIQFAIAATAMAMEESGLTVTPENATRIGVSIGSGIGGFEVIERENRMLLERGPDRVSPFFILSAIVNLAAGHVSVRYGAKGPNSAVATACTTGAHAIGDAYRLIQHGYADAMICGGAEASRHAAGCGGIRGDAGPLDAQRRSAARQPALGSRPRRVRRRRRRGHPDPRRARARAGARRRAARRTGRVCAERGRASSDGAAGRWRRRQARDDARRSRTRGWNRRASSI